MRGERFAQKWTENPTLHPRKYSIFQIESSPIVFRVMLGRLGTHIPKSWADNFDGDALITDSSGTKLASFGHSHYVANSGQDEAWGNQPPQRDWRTVATGRIYRNSRVRVGDAICGRSNSLLKAK